MSATLRFAGLDLDLSLQTDPPAGLDLTVPGAGGDAAYEWEVTHGEPGADRLLVAWRLRRRDGAPFRVVDARVAAAVPAVDLHRVFVPVLHEGIGKRDWISLPWGVDEVSFATWSLPFIAALNRDDGSRFCMGFLDHVHPARAVESCYDEAARLELRRDVAPRTTTAWVDGVYLSRAPGHVFDAMRAFARVWDAFHGVRQAPAPAAAWDPVWCSWYGIKDEVDAAYIAGLAPRLADWGFGSVIVDAGWFAADHFDAATGHYTAHPAKFPDLPGLVRQVQALGLQVLLWCAPLFRLDQIAGQPWVARHRYHPEGQAQPEAFLCPRCPAVRAYAARTVAHVLRTYGCDGLKIDFLDPLQARAARPCRADHEHDLEDYGDAVHDLLAGVHRAITGVRADALIEFRMNYSTLATRAFATSHRAQDAPFDADHIRRMCTRLKSWILDPEAGAAGNVAPHTDPAYWLPEEPEANVARFLASLVTSAVPMLSMDLRALPERHQRLVRAWLAFYREHRDLLLFGQHRVLGNDPHHSLFQVRRGQVALWGIFTPQAPGLLAVPVGVRRLWILNGSSGDRLCCMLTGWPAAALEVRLYDRALVERRQGRLVATGDGAVLDVPVEVGGAVEVRVADAG